MKWLVWLFLFPLLAQGGEKTFRVRLPEDLGTLDWNYGEVNPEVIYQVMEGLFRTDAKGNPKLAVAKRYAWNAKKTQLTVYLKDKLWSDGRPVCAQDFVTSWNRLSSKEFASPYAHYAHVLDTFYAKGCKQLEVKFRRSAPEALALLSHYVFFPLRSDVAAQEKFFQAGVGLVVNGPFLIKEWVVNQKMVLSKNEKYKGKRYLDKIEFLFIPDESTAKILFEQGKLDWFKDIPPLLRTKNMEASKDFHSFPSMTAYYFGLNERKSILLNNPLIRRALNQSLQRKEIATVLGKENRGLSNWLFTETVAASPTLSRQEWTEAKSLLQQSQKTKTLDLYLRVYNKSAHKLLAEWAQGQWQKNLGVRIPIEVQEGKVYWKELTSNPPPIFLSGITAPFAHERAYMQEFLSTSTANWSGWKNTAYDKAVENGNFKKAEKILQQEGFIIPLYSKDITALVKEKWKGFSMNPLGQVFLSDVHL